MRFVHWLLFVACICIFALRLFIAFSSPGLSSDDAYFDFRQIEHIKHTGLPVFDDPLSYGGRTYLFSPVFHYLIAATTFVMPLEIAVKLVPNLLATLLVPIIFGIVRRLSKRDGVALFISVFSAFVPVWFAHTINTVSPITLAVPLLFLVVYAWLRVEEVRWRYVYLCSLVLFAFTHPLSLLFVLSLMLYLLLVVVEHVQSERTELEITLFSIFFVLWSQFLLYKKFILAHGPAVVWQNIPPSLLSSFFSDVTILAAIYQIGILPVFYGLFVVYHYLFRRKHKMTYFLIAFALAAGLLLWFRLIPLRLGLILLGMFLLVLFSKWIDFFLNYVPTTRFPQWRWVYVVSLIFVFILTNGIPAWIEAQAMQRDALSSADQRVYAWIRDMTLPDAVVVAAVDEGHRVTALAQRKNIVDTHFLLQHDAKQRLQDATRILETTFGVEAIELMDRYGATLVLLSPATMRSSNRATLEYADRSPCFARVFEEGGYLVYKKHAFCTVEVIA